MDIEFQCDACGKDLIIDEAGAALAIDCPVCHRKLLVPSLIHLKSRNPTAKVTKHNSHSKFEPNETLDMLRKLPYVTTGEELRPIIARLDQAELESSRLRDAFNALRAEKENVEKCHESLLLLLVKAGRESWWCPKRIREIINSISWREAHVVWEMLSPFHQEMSKLFDIHLKISDRVDLLESPEIEGNECDSVLEHSPLRGIDCVEKSPKKNGELVFMGTSVSVKSLYKLLQNGGSIDVFLTRYPSVAREQVEAVLLDNIGLH